MSNTLHVAPFWQSLFLLQEAAQWLGEAFGPALGQKWPLGQVPCSQSNLSPLVSTGTQLSETQALLLHTGPSGQVLDLLQLVVLGRVTVTE